METKKSTKANLEKQKPTLYLIGLVLAVAFTLESFEWMGVGYKSLDIVGVGGSEEPIEFIQEIEIERPEVKHHSAPKQKNPEYVKAVDEDITKKDDVKKDDDKIMPDIDPDDFVDDGDDDGSFYFDDTDNDIFIIVEEMPEYPGGIPALYKYIGKNVRYPVESYRAGSEGKALINFTIEKDGSITDVKSVGGNADKFCQEEAIRVIESLPKWKAGKQRGKKVRVSYTIPVSFRLD